MHKIIGFFIILLFTAACSPFAPDIPKTDNDQNISRDHMNFSNSENNDSQLNEEEETPDHQGTALHLVNSFHLDINLSEDQVWYFHYHRTAPESAEVRRPDSESFSGSEAVHEVEALVTRVSVSKDHSVESIVNAIVDALNADSSALEYLSFSFDMTNGERYSFDTQMFQTDQEQEEIVTFTLDLQFYSGGTYEIIYDQSEQFGRITTRSGSVHLGADTFRDLNDYLDKININYDDSFELMQQSILDPLGINQYDVENLLMKVEFDNGEQFEFQHIF